MTGTETVLGAPVERREGAGEGHRHRPVRRRVRLPGRAQGWPVPAAVARGRVTGVDPAPRSPCPAYSRCSRTRTRPGSGTRTTPPWPCCRARRTAPGLVRRPGGSRRRWRRGGPRRCRRRPCHVRGGGPRRDAHRGASEAYVPESANGGFRPSPNTATPRAPSPRRRRASTSSTGYRHCTTTRWNRTPARRSGTATG